MQQFLRYAEKKGASFVELKSILGSRNFLQVQDKDVKELSSGTSQLYGVRVFVKGKEGVAFSTKQDYKRLIDQAVKYARLISTPITFTPLPALKKKFVTKVKEHPDSISLEEKKKFVLKLAQQKQKFLRSLTLDYSDMKKEFSYVNSEGREFSWNDLRIIFRCHAYAQDGDRNESYLDTFGSHEGFERMKETPALVSNTCKIAVDLLKAKQPIGGNFPVIVDQHLGGVFAHEAVGHACEADAILQGTSVLKGKLNTLVGNESVTIVDDKLQLSNGQTLVDDEGVCGGKTYLVKEGVLQSYLHNRVTASLLKMEPTGNGRAQSLSEKPIPRMTCTYVENGKSSFDAMLKTIQDGYYLKGTLGGQVNPASGEFLFNAQYGYLIKKGEMKSMVKAASLTGNIAQTLFNIHLVGNDLKFNAGTCGKDGQYVPVGDGAPHFKIDLARVGGQ